VELQIIVIVFMEVVIL